MAFHFYAGVETPIFTGNAPTSFTDLVLPASVPLSCVVRLRFVHKSTADPIGIGLRPNGNTTIEIPALYTPAGVSGCTLDDTDGVSAELMSATTDRTVEWGATVAQAVDIHLVGYHDATVVDPTCAGAKALNGQSISTSWTTDLDIGLAAARVIVLLEVQRHTTDEKIAWRPSDETEDVLLEYNSSGLKSEQMPQPNGGDTYKKHVIMTTTGADGLVDASSVTDSPVIHAYVHATIPVDDHYATALATYSVTTSYSNLDLSGVVGAVDGIAILKVKKTSLSKTSHMVAFRPDGSSEVVDIITEYSGGGCNRATINDFDEHIPSVSSQTPTPSSTISSPTATVSFSISDAGSDVDTGTIDVDLEGVNAIQDGSFQGGYGGSVGASSVSISTHPAFTTTPITCSYRVGDAQGSFVNGNWSFNMSHPPTIGSLSPANGATDVSYSATVSASFSDSGSDIVAASIDVTINGVTAIVNGSVTGEGSWAGSCSAAGFSLSRTMCPGETEVVVHVEDALGSEDNEIWSFTVIDLDQCE